MCFWNGLRSVSTGGNSTQCLGRHVPLKKGPQTGGPNIGNIAWILLSAYGLMTQLIKWILRFTHCHCTRGLDSEFQCCWNSHLMNSTAGVKHDAVFVDFRDICWMHHIMVRATILVYFVVILWFESSVGVVSDSVVESIEKSRVVETERLKNGSLTELELCDWLMIMMIDDNDDWFIHSMCSILWEWNIWDSIAK